MAVTKPLLTGFYEFLNTPEGQRVLLEQLRSAVTPEEFDKWCRGLKVLNARINRVQQLVRSGDPLLQDGRHWLLRPVRENMCKYESLKDGTLDLADIALMNAEIDAREPRAKPKETSAPRLGRPADKRDPVEAAMREAIRIGRFSVMELRGMKQSALAEMFHTERSTAARALSTVLKSFKD